MDLGIIHANPTTLSFEKEVILWDLVSSSHNDLKHLASTMLRFFSDTILIHGKITLPETNSQFAPENGWLEDDPASFWDGIFLVKLAVRKFQRKIRTCQSPK